MPSTVRHTFRLNNAEELVPSAIRYLEFRDTDFQEDVANALLDPTKSNSYDREMVATVISALVLSSSSVNSDAPDWIEHATEEYGNNPSRDHVLKAIRAVMHLDAVPKILSVLHHDGPSKSHFRYQELAKEFVENAIFGDPEIRREVKKLL